MMKSFSKIYPNLYQFTQSHGWQEIGVADPWNDNTLVRLLDEGGKLWDSGDNTDIDKTMQQAEEFVRGWLAEAGLD